MFYSFKKSTFHSSIWFILFFCWNAFFHQRNALLSIFVIIKYKKQEKNNGIKIIEIIIYDFINQWIEPIENDKL